MAESLNEFLDKTMRWAQCEVDTCKHSEDKTDRDRFRYAQGVLIATIQLQEFLQQYPNAFNDDDDE